MGTTITTASTIGRFLPSYWDSVLGENLYPNLYLYQFGTKRSIPRNFGKNIKIPRYRKMSTVGSLVASEGTAPTASAASADTISGTISQFGGVIKHSDLLLMTALSDFVELSLADLARDLAKVVDNRIRRIVSGTGLALGAGNIGSGASISTSVGLTDILRPKNVLHAAVRLDMGDNARPPDQHYPMVIHPRAVYDLQSTSNTGYWLDINKYTDAGARQIYQGEVGRLYGVRFVASTESAKRVNTGMSVAGTSGYCAFMFAPNAYYVSELNGDSAKTFVKQLGSAGTADPINQQATVGAKVLFGVVPATWTATEYRVLRIYHATTI